MKAFFTSLILMALLAFDSSSAVAADKSEAARQPRKSAHKTSKPARLFADTKKYIAENAAKTAKIVKINAANLKKRVSAEPEPAAKTEKPQPQRSVKTSASAPEAAR
jgi:predicted lipid-binding transport protein (Tim44 family)